MSEQHKEQSEEQKGFALSIFSIFALAAAAALIIAFFMPMLKVSPKILSEFKSYKANFEKQYAQLQARIDEIKKEEGSIENQEIDTEEFADFFKNYGFLVPNVKKIKVADVQKFKEIIDALFVMLEKGSLKSLYQFSKVLEKNKSIFVDVIEAANATDTKLAKANADELVKTFSAVTATMKWLSLGAPIVAVLLILFVLFSRFGKFNFLFLVLTYLPAVFFTITGGFTLIVMPKLPDILAKLSQTKQLQIPEQINNFLTNISAGTGVYLAFIAGILMLIVSLFGASKKNSGLVYGIYFLITVGVVAAVLLKLGVI